MTLWTCLLQTIPNTYCPVTFSTDRKSTFLVTVRKSKHLVGRVSQELWEELSTNFDKLSGFSLKRLKPKRRMCSRGLSDEEAAAACKQGHPMTKDYMMQHTMLRVKDPDRSLDFYTGILGMTLLQKIDFSALGFCLYLVGYEEKANIPENLVDRTAWTFSRHGAIKLLHNRGAEKDRNLSYHSGNTKPLGFGHIGISVPNLAEACTYFEERGVTFVKEAGAGKIKNLAFIQDPDGYWIEILSPKKMCEILS